MLPLTLLSCSCSSRRGIQTDSDCGILRATSFGGIDAANPRLAPGDNPLAIRTGIDGKRSSSVAARYIDVGHIQIFRATRRVVPTASVVASTGH